MSNEFLKSNRELDEAITSATTIEEMRERMLSTLAKQGTIVRDNRDAFNTRTVPQPSAPAPVSPLPASNEMQRCSDTFIRGVYPSGNNKFEIYASSEAELDSIERQIRAMFAR
jgi:chorismate-pyruvate lyase